MGPPPFTTNALVLDLKANRFAKGDGALPDPAAAPASDHSICQIFHPTDVRLDVHDDGKRLDNASLGTYDWKAEKLE